MESRNDLLLDISTRQIMKMTLPISFAIFIPQINFVTNNIFLGNFSPDALAVAGITGVYYLIFTAIGYGFNNGLQSLIARRAGENRPEEIGKLFNQALVLVLGMSLLGILITWTLTPVVFASFIREPERLREAVLFSKIRIWGLPFLYVYQLRNALLVGTNQSRYLVVGTLAETITNIFLDYVLIFGHFGMPALGLNGAAIASIIAEFTGMLVIYEVIRRKGITKRFGLFQSHRPDSYQLRLILSISAPLIFQHAISICSWEYFFLLIDGHGVTALAVSNSMRNFFGIFGIVTWAFAATTNAMVSNILGQGRPDQLWELLNKILRISVSVSVVTALLLNLFPGQVLAIYGQPASFTEAAIPVLRVISVAMILMSFSTVMLNAVIGSGHSRVSFLIEAGTILLYCIFVYLVLKKFNLSITYGWMSELLYWTCLFIPSFWFLKSGRWKTKSIFEKSAGPAVE